MPGEEGHGGGVLARRPIPALPLPTGVPGAHRIGSLLLLAVVGLLALGPVLLIAINSFVINVPGQPDRIGLDAWQMVLASPSLLGSLWNTLALAGARVLIAVPVGLLMIWLLVRTDMPGRGAIETLAWVAFFLPAVPVTLAWILLLDPGYGLVNEWLRALPFIDESPFSIYSFAGIVFVHLVLTTIPAQILLVAPAFRLFDANLEHSSRVAGAGNLRTMLRVTIPLLAPTILVAAVLSMVRAMESFEVEQLLGVPIGLDVYSTRIYNFLRYDPPEFAAASALGTLLLVLMLPLVLVHQVSRGSRHHATVSGREFSTIRVHLGRWRWPAFGLCLVIVTLGTIVPLTVLGVGSFMKLFGFFDIPDPFTLGTWQRVFDHPYLAVTLRNSVTLAAGAAVLGVLSLSVVSYLVVRRSVRHARALDLLTWLPWFLPGILLGLGLLWAFLFNPLLRPLHGTMLGLILVIVIKEMPVATQIMKGAIGQISTELEQASRVSGAGWWRSFFRITLPLIAPSAVSVGLVIFMAALRDVSAVLLLSTSETQPISVLVLQFSVTGDLEAAAATGLMLSLIVVALALIGRKIARGASVG